ncbi:MAG: type II CRISPR RNA-guided endonuclease Cas9 [Eggerthellaceae bacterium]|jgi:CRISPR-associated endonuclease Csn1
MNLRNVGSYNIGLDIGTGSVGWAVTDDDGNLCHFKGKPTWGSRIFPNAQEASEARTHRGQRRRYDRRRQRLDLLQQIFASEMETVDSEFFIRLNQSRLLKEDRAAGHDNYRWPLFNDSDFTEVDYYQRFPTIYHLRVYLMESSRKEDLRLIYLALHNIVKTRGNFLHQDNARLSAKNASMSDSINRFADAFEAWCEEWDIEASCDRKELCTLFEDQSLSRADKQTGSQQLLGLSKDYEKTLGKPISQAIVGYKANFSSIFFLEGDDQKFALDNDEKVAEFEEVCPDEGFELFEALQAVYSSYILMGILKGANGQTLSYCKVREYEKYGKDLKVLKELVRDYAPDQYHEFFCGQFYPGTHEYDPSKAKGYTKYNVRRGGTSYDDFQKEVKKLFEGTAAESDKRYTQMMEDFTESNFLRRLKTSDNGSIPYQLHLEEMHTILQKQGEFYSFLLENAERIESLVTFRIPYYVGPLTTKNAALDASGEKRFAWSVRQPGKENERIFPWNWEEIIDKHGSAQAFIERMTGTCTYLQGEPVLPRCSLLYERYCVLNELNGAKWTQDGDDIHRFSYDFRAEIMEDLFERGKKVSYKAVENWLKRKGYFNAHVFGGQGETGFESKLSSYGFFTNLLGVDYLSAEDERMVEELIKWNTLFEDRNILKAEIKRAYGDRLSDEQIEKICKKRFAGWGRLSEKLLIGLKAHTDDGPKSIMDILEEGNPNYDHKNQAMVFMEILHDDDLEFGKMIDAHNKAYLEKHGRLSLEELPGSPALRRSVNQSLRIIAEIRKIAGHDPSNIYIEVTREEDPRNKGNRTRTRYNNLKEALAAFKKENPELLKSGLLGDFNKKKPEELDERLTLYFMQNGKSLYSGKALDIKRLSEYQVDHIIPQTYIKDDSFENKALVLAQENQEKSDSLLLSEDVRRKMHDYWDALHKAKLIGDKKYRNLMRASISDDRLKGFIARQLVETSQIVKIVQMMLKDEYIETAVVPVKASLSSQLRKAEGFVKCRELNDYHHAHDALLACEMGRFIQKRHPDIYDNPMKYTKVVRSLVKTQKEKLQKTGNAPGSSSFIVQSFLSSGFDKETGEVFKDDWDAEAECDRIRRFLNYKDCFISRMPEITTGAFWDATIYSPKQTKKALELPLKGNLNPRKYGSYSREQFAYFFIYKAINRKNNKSIIEFAGVPVSVQARLESNPDYLVEYATSLAESMNCDFLKIVKERVYKYQLFEWNGNRLYITGGREARNARQLAFSQAIVAKFKEAIEGTLESSTEAVQLFDEYCVALDHYATRLSDLLALKELRDGFAKADIAAQQRALVSLLKISCGSCNMINLSEIGGGKYVGCIQPTYKKIFSDPTSEVWFIDTSVTGMFERRYKLEL